MSVFFRRSFLHTGALLVVAFAVAAALVSPGGRASAAGPVTRTWTGAGANSNWNNNANWNPAAPNPGDILVFPEAALRKTNTNNFAAGTAFTTIRFEGAGYSVSGNRVAISGQVNQIPDFGGVNNLAIVISGDGSLVVNSGTLNVLAANQYSGTTFVNGGTLHAGGSSAFAQSPLIDIFAGTLTLAPGVSMFNDILIGGPSNPVVKALGSSQWHGDFVISGDGEVDVAPGATFTISGALAGSDPLVKTGPGRLTLSGVSPLFLSTIEVREGILRATRQEAFGAAFAGTEVSDGATLELETMSLPGEQLEIRGDGFENMGALRHLGGISNIGNVFVADDAMIRVDEGILRLTNGFDGAGEHTLLDKQGQGTLEPESNGNFDGILTVFDGELAVRGILLCDVVVQGGLVTGNGEVADLTANFGTVKPGVTGKGVLTATGDLQMAIGSDLSLTIESVAESSSLRVHGLIDLDNPKLLLEGAGTVPLGGGFFVIENFGPADILGTFDGLPEGQEFDYSGLVFQMTYAADGTGDAVLLHESLELAETDLGVAVKPLPNSAARGSILPVTYELRNLGPETAGFVMVTIAVRDGAHFESFEIPEPWTCEAPNGGQGGPLKCTREDWAPTGPDNPVVVVVEFTLDGDIGDAVLFDIFMVYEGVDPDDSNQIAHRFVDIVAPDPRPFKLRLPFLAKDGTN